MHENIKGGALTEATFYVLLSVYKPKHGYGIMKFVADMTSGRVILGAGTLYGIINVLEKKNWIERYINPEDDRKKEYKITETGNEIALKELQRLEELCSTAHCIIEGGDTYGNETV